MKVYAIFCGGEFDQAVETRELANREKRDLEQTGHDVTVKLMTWAQIDALVDN